MRSVLLIVFVLFNLIIQAQEKALQEYFPLKLFFANDEPNPKTNFPSTEFTYSETYKSYQSQFKNYLKDGEHFSYLLEGDIEPNYKQFQLIKPLLLDSLKAGRRIVLTIKGFASPLHFSDYNINISKRRIETFVNEIKSNKEFLPFITSKQLIFEKLPFGEYSAHESVNDKLDSTHLSVYHMQASYERRIEVELKEITEISKPLLYSEIAYSDVGNVKRGEVIKHQFIVRNLGEEELQIKNIAVSCGCSLAETELKILQKEEETVLNLEVNTENLAFGKQVKSITVFYNNGASKRYVILIEVR